MQFRKSFIFILTLVLFTIVVIAFFRSPYVYNIIKNKNSFEKTEELQKLTTVPSISSEAYLIITDKNEPNSILISDNLKMVLDYMKKNYTQIDVQNLNNIASAYNTIFITFENLDIVNNLNYILDYTGNGGKVLFLERPLECENLESIKYYLGINSIDELVDTKGITLLDNILIKGTNLTISEDFILNSSLKTALDSNCRVYAVSEDKIPLLWSYKYKNGSFMVFNGTMLNEKINRGLLAGAISNINEDFIYPVLNSKLYYIDDFPAPIPSGYNEFIKDEFDIDTEVFYRQIFWPDIIKGIKAYNIKYTGVIIETYNNNVTPPFASIGDNKNLLFYGRELLRNGGEIGIHGYNHQSLALKGFIKQPLNYNPWNLEYDMIEALQEVYRYAKEVFPYYDFRVYVPPSNILSPEGRAALLKAIPNIKIISSVYINHYLKDSYAQEFEISKDGICELPRLSSGYENSEENIWGIYNGITSLGIVSHFIHPDDVLDRGRNGNKGWEELIKEYNSMLKLVKDDFSYLNSVSASQGGEELKKYADVIPYISFENDTFTIACDNFRKDTYFYLRTDKSIKENKGCTLIKIDTNYYLVRAALPNFTISLSR